MMPILDEIILVVKSAGKHIMQFYEQEIQVSYKDDKSPVTKADIEAEEILKEGLAHFNFGCICEETPEDYLEHDYVWVIDPLDGTKDFVEKTGEFAVMVGLLYKNKPILGVVYAPALDKLYTAKKGEGAFLNGKPIQVSTIKDLRQFRVVTSKFHFDKKDQSCIDRLNVLSVKKVGSAGVKVGLVAEGKAELYFNRHDFMGKWDCCAPQVILEEAGGAVYDINGAPLSYESEKRNMPTGIIATNNTNKEQILRILNPPL
ncbi:MAG: 3'(2'),5'-bisphosphate nucleotidase CysQ [Candidatus Woesearchaeota archaeon]